MKIIKQVSTDKSDGVVSKMQCAMPLMTSLLLLSVVSGCAWLPAKSIDDAPGVTEDLVSDNRPSSSDELIAYDLLSAMSKLDGFKPSSTTVQTLPPSSTFDFAMRSALERLGYATRTVESDVGNNLLKYSMSNLPDEDYRVHRKYKLSFRSVILERSYLFDLQDVKTGSQLMVAGALPIEHTPTDTVLTSAKVTDNSLAGLTDASTKSFGGLKPKRNVYEIGGSNYAQILNKREQVKKSVLIFGNDSLVMGDVNKREIDTFVEAFNPELDLFSIIGCSHGATSIVNGNALLATGRAQRVKEALLYAGVPEDRILDEGCWDPKYGVEEMPDRGVVITLNRRS